MAQIRQLEGLQKLRASGTSEGSQKGWDTRGRGRKATVGGGVTHEHTSVLREHGWQASPYKQSGGSRQFVLKGQQDHVLTVHPDGSWEHDNPDSSIMPKGKDAQSLQRHLDNFHKTGF